MDKEYFYALEVHADQFGITGVDTNGPFTEEEYRAFMKDTKFTTLVVGFTIDPEDLKCYAWGEDGRYEDDK